MTEKTKEEITNEINQLFAYLENLTASELFQIVKASEDSIGSGGSAILSVVASLFATATAQKRNFYIILTSYGTNKIAAIREVREITGLGFKDAKDLVETTLPTLLKECTFKFEANEIKDKMENAGATVKITSDQKQHKFDDKLASLGESIMRSVKELKSIIIEGYQLLNSLDFDVILISFGTNKIAAIREVREITGLGLRDAKDLVESAPAPIKKGISLDEAFYIKEKLETSGATVKITSKEKLKDLKNTVISIENSPESEEKDGFDVILISFGTNKIAAIREVREITGLGLRDAKDLVESAPSVILKDVSMQEALNIKDRLESTGAILEIK